MRCTLLFLLFLLYFQFGHSQIQSVNWVFGDSVGISFINNNPVVFTTSGLSSLEASSSVSDSLGNMLFYVGPNSYLPGPGHFDFSIWDSTNTIMPNGTNIKGATSMTEGALIIPSPSNQATYYVFTIEDSSFYGPVLYYSIVDMTLANGNGDVSLKNVLLTTGPYPISERLDGIRHGNGRDWWIFTHELGSNRYVKYLISNTGVHGPYYQNIGPVHTSNFDIVGQSCISPSGQSYLIVNQKNNAELYDINRCTGLLSNYNYFGDTTYNYSSARGYYGASFSPDGTKLYISNSDSIFQFEADSPNIKLTKSLIFSSPCNDTCFIGQHLLGPDNKIYIANSSGASLSSPFFNNYNMNISFIENPNAKGPSCNFNYLGLNLISRKSLFGLPNFPSYNLGVISGSSCDTIVGIHELFKYKISLTINPNPNNGRFEVNYELPQNEIASIEIVNTLGEVIYSSYLPKWSTVHRLNLDLAKGIYQAVITTSKGRESTKVLIQ